MASIDIHVRSIFRFDEEGHFVGMHDYVAHDLPRVHIGFSTDTDEVSIRVTPSIDNVDDWIGLVSALRSGNDPPNDERSFHRWRALIRAALPNLAEDDVTGGPAYVANPPAIPDALPGGTALVTADNAHHLDRFHSDWLADVPHQQPMAVALLGGDAIAVCSSARRPPVQGRSDVGYQAGLETAPHARRRGYATLAVKAWCRGVHIAGATPVYSTSWDNVASQRVARRCGLHFIGSDISVG